MGQLPRASASAAHTTTQQQMLGMPLLQSCQSLKPRINVRFAPLVGTGQRMLSTQLQALLLLLLQQTDQIKGRIHSARSSRL
jgi:hypothetical protein